MMTIKIKTDTQYNFTKAENDIFSWDRYSPDYLTYKPTGQRINQMEWYEWKNSQPITDQSIRDAVTGFWAELETLQNHKPTTKMASEDPEPKHGENGYCRKCHSYCYGDCEAN